MGRGVSYILNGPSPSAHPRLPIGQLLNGPSPSQCCQVAEIPAKKLKRGRRKKSWPKEFVAEFWLILEKGPQKIFKRSSLFLAVITTYNVHQDKIKSDF